MSQRYCQNCGQPIARKNKFGYCSRTPECKSLYQQAWQDSRRPPDAPASQPCRSCGVPTTAKSGYCKRTKTCDAARHRTQCVPDENRRRCFACGKLLDLRTPVAVALCSSCQDSAETHLKRRKKAEVMAAYGGACTCCGEDNLDFLTIDHVNGDGGPERENHGGGSTFYAWLRARGYPDRDRYQVLCFNCNCAKGAKRECPCRTRKFSAFDILAPGQLALF